MQITPARWLVVLLASNVPSRRRNWSDNTNTELAHERSAHRRVGRRSHLGLWLVPPDAALTCAQHCTNIAMELSAVAVMANNVGCVCQPRRSVGAASHEAATTAGMAAIVMQETARQQQRQQQQ